MHRGYKDLFSRTPNANNVRPVFKSTEPWQWRPRTRRFSSNQRNLSHLFSNWSMSLNHRFLLQLHAFWNKHTYCMEQSPSWEANWFSTSQEIPHILWYPKVHYRIHMCAAPIPILSQIDPVHVPTSHFLKIHLNIILPSMLGSGKCSLSLRFPHQNPVYTSRLTHTCYLPRPSYSRSDHPNNIGWGVQIINILIV